jgi:hypothetical protein
MCRPSGAFLDCTMKPRASALGYACVAPPGLLCKEAGSECRLSCAGRSPALQDALLRGARPFDCAQGKLARKFCFCENSLTEFTAGCGVVQAP